MHVNKENERVSFCLVICAFCCFDVQRGVLSLFLALILFNRWPLHLREQELTTIVSLSFY